MADLPEGFTLDAPGAAALPEGFTLDAPRPPPSGTDKALRRTALAGRAVGEGVASTLLSPLDAMISLINAGGIASNRYLGTNFPHQTTYSEMLSQGLDQAGAPTAETRNEQLATAGIRGAAGAMTGVGALNGATTLPPAIRAGTAGASSGTATELARQKGVGPLGQLAIGTAAGLVPGAAEESVRLAGRTAANLVRPLTRSGQQTMAGNVLADQASNPSAAVNNLRTAREIVPGSQRNTGEASQDVGLLALEKGLRSRDSAPFGQRMSEQNAARQAEMTRVAGTESDVTAAENARDASTGPMRSAALSAGGQANVAPVVSAIDKTLASPIGKRDIPSQALTWLRDKLHDANGNPETDPANLYAIRQDIGDALGGKLGGEQAKFRLASGQLIQVRKELDNAIEAAAPGFKAYLQRYADMSKPIDQMKAMQEIQQRATLTAIDPTTHQPLLGSAPFTRALNSALQDDVKLTPAQLQTLRAVQTDLQLGQAVNSPLVKAPGSDTFQNLSIAQVIGGGPAGGHPAFRVLSRPVQWVYKLAGSDDAVAEALTKAMLDPKIAAQMLERATPGRMQAFAAALRARVGAATVGTAAGTSATLRNTPSDKSTTEASQ